MRTTYYHVLSCAHDFLCCVEVKVQSAKHTYASLRRALTILRYNSILAFTGNFEFKNKVATDTWQTTWSKRRVRICTIHSLILLSFAIIQMLLKIILVTFKNLFLTLWCLYPSQRVAKGMTRPSVSQSVRQSCFSCQRNSSGNRSTEFPETL